eukprot:m.67187 g.67187  ORF g.67187 m.67187 type:complete len:511 (+) comp14098_c0_seq1:174-1706(+)
MRRVAGGSLWAVQTLSRSFAAAAAAVATSSSTAAKGCGTTTIRHFSSVFNVPSLPQALPALPALPALAAAASKSSHSELGVSTRRTLSTHSRNSGKRYVTSTADPSEETITGAPAEGFVNMAAAHADKFTADDKVKAKEPEIDMDESHLQRKKVLIIHTGGTFAMKPNNVGSLDNSPGNLQEMLKNVDELQRAEMPLFDVKEYTPLMDSSSMAPTHWLRLAKDIEENYFLYDGFVVIMGTDTMAYAASAVSFLLENLGKTVVFTGSMIPFSEVYNDSRRNLIVSMIFAVSTDFPEVCIFFHEKLMRANRTTKVNSFGLAAFESPNMEPLATLAVNIRVNARLPLPQPRAPFRAHKAIETGILVVRLVPGFPAEVLTNIVEKGAIKALVFEIFGTGNVPLSQSELFKLLDLARERGVLVFATSQCLHGCVIFDAYAAGRVLIQAGVTSTVDMTTEAVVTKLGYLLSKYRDPQKVRELMSRSLRGELSDESIYRSRFFNRDAVVSKLICRCG